MTVCRNIRKAPLKYQLLRDVIASAGIKPEPRPVNVTLYDFSVWVLPLVIAITFHEAAHGYVAHRLGDNTAYDLGRVSFNPIRHIDPFGTLIMPAILLISHSPFLFGYAKPVPVNFRALNNPRIGMVLVALAGPATNIALALVAAAAFHAVDLLPDNAAQWVEDNLKNALVINVILAIFNMMPIPPLDGGRVAVGLLPRALALPLSRLEPFGMLILIGLLILLPLAGSQFGLNLDVISAILRTMTGYVIRLILIVTGNG
jgi:Zn-dependent protease